MKTAELLQRLNALGVKLWVEGAELKVSAPRGAVTPELRAALAGSKQELVEILAPRSAADEGPIPRWRAAEGGSPELRPMSFQQKRVWFLDQLDPGLIAYNMWVSLTLRGPLDEEAFERALREIVRRHEVLRSSFPAEDGVPAQRLHPPEWIRLERLERPAGLDERAWRTALHAELTRRVGLAFDLAGEPLFQPLLASVGPAEHLFFARIHHVVYDGLSNAVLARELDLLYDAFSRGEPSPLSELALQYHDWAAWQARRFEGEHLERELAWWRRTLAGELPVLELPFDRPRPRFQTHVGANHTHRLDDALAARLDPFARARGTTVFSVMLAAYQALLARVSGQEDVLVGTAAANRGRAELEALIGYFVNTLVVRTDLSGDPRFEALIERAEAAFLGAWEHQEVPFERLVDELQPERNQSTTPLFQTLFVLNQDTGAKRELGGLEVVPYSLEIPMSRTDLVLTVYKGREGTFLDLEYNTDLFERATVARLGRWYEALLADALARPERRLSELAPCPAEELAQVLGEWNDTAAPIPPGSIDEQVRAAAARHPEAIALVVPGDGPDGDRAWSYAELLGRADRIAWHLRERGVRPGELVGLCTERDADMLCGLLGILACGAAYVPLDPGFPRERLAYMVEDAGLARVVTIEPLAHLVPDGVDRVLLDREAEAIAARPPTAPPLERCASRARERMYVIYTSGSTGRPKGVELEHRGVSSFLASMRREPGMRAGEALLAVTTLSFDISVLELFLPLTTGGTVVLAPRSATGDGDRLRALLERLEPSLMQATPATWRMLILSGWRGRGDLRVLCGGEALTRELADELLERSAELWNLYGPTEATVWSAAERIAAGGAPITIGRPIANTRFYVLDARRRPVPPGVTGELWIAGDGLARGYLGRPALSAERFAPDPFAGEPGARMYATGDLGRWLPRADGPAKLLCLGRTDHQVKLRGYRIELGEIEAALNDVEGVHDCAVIVREDRPGDRRLVAYWVAAPEPAADGDGPSERERLEGALARGLPAYMLPAQYVRLEELPLTPNGKVDRRALGALAPVEASAGADYVAPRDALEERLAALFAAVLGVERVGIHDSFFALGGNSLLTTQVLARVRAELAVELPLRALFEDGSVAAFAQRVREAKGAHLEPIPRLERPADAPFRPPLSFPQERLWFLDQLEPGLSAYNMWPAATLRGPLDLAVLGRAVAEVTRRHEVLRTRFASGPEGPAQVIDAEGAPLEVLGAEEAADREARRRALLARLEERSRRPFDLAEGPLFQPVVARVADDEHLLVFFVHHVVFDGWSIAVVFRELAALYPAFLEGRPSPLPELRLQYADFAAWQRARLAEPAFEEQLAWWRETLGGELPVLELPTDRPRPRIQSYAGATRRRRLSPETVEALRSLARAEGCTLFMALLAVYDVLLARTSGQEEVCVGTAVAGRERAELEPAAGFFVNTLVLRTDLSGEPSFRELLARVRRATLGAFEHQEVPFERLVDELAPERDLATTPLFQTLFVLDHDTGEARRMGPLALEPLELESRIARCDLTLWGYDGRDGFELAAEFATALFDPETIDALLERFEVLAAAAAARPELAIGALPILSERERSLLERWNETATGYPREASIPALFEQQVARSCDAVAAVFVPPAGSDEPRVELTYADLDRRANRLAWHLIELGVGPDTLVGLCTERSLPMLVGILGILKAGGAYVPLDPGYPRERLGFMIEDAGLEVILAQRRLASRPDADELPFAFEGSLVDLDDETLFATRPAEAPPRRSGPRDLAYVMFTSGSTGRPKGVAVEHKSVLRLVCEPDYCSLGPEETILHFAPISFDASTFEVWGALLSGGRMVVYPPVAPSLEELGAVLRDEHVTTAWLTAGLFSLMVDEELESLRGLRQLLAGGDVLPVAQVNRVLRELPELRLINGYGPTENTTFTCCHQISDGGPVEGSVPIGRPISDTRVRIADRRGQAVPIGVFGELLIGGDGLARGYLRRPELTRERFVADPERPGERLYRTGDVVRWLRDGTIEFQGRRDDQVKVRGYRIELGEIEAALGALEGVRECAVVVREDEPGDKRIVGYVVPASEQDGADLALLRRRLADSLPGYMVPAHLMALSALPLSPNGKVDRKALPAPDASAASGTEGFVAPRDAVEERVAAIWSAVLGTPRVGVHDNFFALGGNSLLSTKAMAELRRAFDVELPLRRLFEEPTVAGLARHLRGGDRHPGAGRSYAETFDACLIPLQPRGWRAPLFLVSGAHSNEDAFLRFVGALLPHMGQDQPIWGFKARGLDGVSPPHASAEEMAADYVREMRELRPEGPYLLAGNCVGGIVAFEMARQLREAGQEVALVALLDTVRPQEDYRAFVDHHFRFWKLERFRGHLRALGELTGRERLGYFWSRAKRKLGHAVALTEEKRRARHILAVEREYSKILARYEPKWLDGRATVIVNEELDAFMPAAGWTEFAREVETHVVPGDHVTRLSVNAGQVARILRECIERAVGDQRQSA